MRWVALFAIAALVSCRGCGDQPGGNRASVSNDKDNITDAAGDATEATQAIDTRSFLVRAHVPGLAWAYVTRDGIRSAGDGVASIEADRRGGGEHVGPTHAFQVASLAKPIIATCVMRLVEQGKLRLDDDVRAWVTFDVGARRRDGTREKITLRHLLTHTAALADTPMSERASVEPTSGPALHEFLRAYFTDAGAPPYLDASAGTTMHYSNVGFSLAALIVERVSGMPFAEAARQLVFAPLHLESARFRGQGFAGDDAPSEAWLARPHASLSDGGFAQLPLPSHALYPVVDLYASAADMAGFLRAILFDQLLTRASTAEMLRVGQIDAAPADALGWQARTFGRHHVIGHEGEDRGASTAMYLDIDRGIGAVVLTNGDAFQSDDAARATSISDLMTKLLDEAAARTGSSR